MTPTQIILAGLGVAFVLFVVLLVALTLLRVPPPTRIGRTDGGVPPDADADDETDPADGIPAGVRRPAAGEKMVRVYHTEDLFHAELLRSILLDAGVWCHVDGATAAAWIGPMMGTRGVSLFVPEADEARAKAVVDEAIARAQASRAEDA